MGSKLSQIEREPIATMIAAALGAGAEVMAVYRGTIAVELKADRSPLTAADRRSHAWIVAALSNAMPDVPVLSEEGAAVPYAQRADWDAFFLIDPVDGTKEFIKRNDEFTVNIALMQRNGDGVWYPQLGVVYAPALGELFVGGEGVAVHWTDVTPGAPPPPLSRAVALPRADRLHGRPHTVVASRSHLSPQTQQFIDARRLDHPDLQLMTAGSSLKLCRVADGSADEYPRFAPTMEWDTAAGDAVAHAAGCQVRVWDDAAQTVAERLAYNKEDLHNPHFLVRRNPS